MQLRYGLLVVSFAIAARADGAPPALGERLTADPLATARLARDVGDAALRAALEADKPARREVLAALRAAPFATEPESLIPSLCRWATTRDPDLAPAASDAFVAMAHALSPQELAAREASPAALRKARKALSEIPEHDPAVRDDIAFAAALLDVALADLMTQLALHP